MIYPGYVIAGDESAVTVRVDSKDALRQVQEGAFVAVENEQYLFYGLITGFALGGDPRFSTIWGMDVSPETKQIVAGQRLHVDIKVLMTLMRERSANARPRPVKTIPAHGDRVRLATAEDIEEIFGKEGGSNFVIGYTREQGHPVCLDLHKFVQRSSGVFGATGTGISFLTRLVLAGLIHYDGASVLVFDMHNEYGLDDTASDTGMRVTGLKTKFPARVRVVGLGAKTQIRGQTPDFHLELPIAEIQPGDVEMLGQELNLKETTPVIVSALLQDFGPRKWLTSFRALVPGKKITIVGTNGKNEIVPAPDSLEGWALAAGVNVMAAQGVHSKLQRIFRLPYVVDTPAVNGIQEIVKCLENGQHVVLSFGRHESDLDYLLVTNILARRIREEWEKRTNTFRSTGKREPRPLVIVLEEAHKLLNREVAQQTAFATIAREMRKYYVTLLVIDQRPSQIYDEVMSQLGTRISGWLGDPNDIHSVLSGLAGQDTLQGLMVRLQPKEEVLLLGWGTPMALPVRTRRYDDRFWRELLGGGSGGGSNVTSSAAPAPAQRTAEQSLKDLGFG